MMLLRYYARQINAFNCQYNEDVHQKEQLATRNNTIPSKSVDFIHVYVCEAMDTMQYPSSNARHEVSNKNRLGSVSDTTDWAEIVMFDLIWNTCSQDNTQKS